MSDSKNLRILVIDDNDAIHEDFRKILGSGGGEQQSLRDARSAFFGMAADQEAAEHFELTSARQGLEGLEAVTDAGQSGTPFAMAFVDVRMPPGIDGIQTIKRLWDADPDLQIVICTAYADYSLDEISEELGHSDQLLILKKPFDPVEVKQLAASLTEKWNSLQRERERMADVRRYAESLEEANRALKEANARAEAASRVKSEFLANMSHEIRTPMTAILGYIDLLFDDDVAAEEGESYREIIRRSGQNLLVIINDILDISKIEAGRMVLFPTEFSPRSLGEDVMSVHRSAAAKKGLEVHLEVEDGFPEVMHNDPVRVQQVLSNLVGNAIKFTREGSVRLRVARGADGKARFEVVDTGMGIEPEVLPTLFDAFTQADTSSTRKAGGTGLGLAISKQLAIMLGGDIEVVSELGTGSTFTLCLPLAAAHEGAGPSAGTGNGIGNGNGHAIGATAAAGAVPTPASAARQAEDGDGSQPPVALRGRVLLVEDGKLNQVLISTILKKAGADVLVADNGELGCEQVRAAAAAGQPVDLVLMDMQMPVMDGYEATRVLRAEGVAIPIVALTAHAMAGDRDKCLDAGCSDYATKPVDRWGLLRLCAELLGPQPAAPFPRPTQGRPNAPRRGEPAE